MLRVAKTVATVLFLASAAPLGVAGFANASGLTDAYNHQTDRAFRVGMQMRLAWTGDYKGAFSGEIDATGLRAIRDFQARHGMEANGVVDEPLLKQLVAESDREKTASGFALVDDRTTGVRVALPMTLVTDNGETPIGRVWRSADRGIEIETVRLAGPAHDLASVREMLSQPTATRSVTSDVSSADGFTLTGTEAGRTYVMRFAGIDGDVRGFGISYAPSRASTMAPFVAVATNLFQPFAIDPDENDAPVAELPPLDRNILETVAVGGQQVTNGERRRVASLFHAGVQTDELEVAGISSDKTDSSGSGFAVSHDGWVLTNAHVAGSCRSVLVGDKGAADKIIVDDANDLAAIHVNATFATPLPIAKTAARLGEDVLALGYPLRSILADSLNVTRGNVSSLLGLQNDPRYLQISAPIQPGNSGGPLVDLSGRAVGVVTAKLNAVAIADATGDIPQSINFAIRPDAVASFLQSNGISYTTAAKPERFESVADTTAKVQDSVLPVLCVGSKG